MNLLKKLFRRTTLKMPATQFFDKLIGYPYFWVAHRRLPHQDRMYFNDYMFRLKTSREIENPLRIFVSDKDLVKIFYRGVLGEDLAPRTLMKFNDFESFAKADLPRQCVVKPTHLSGNVVYLENGRDSLTQANLDMIRNSFRKNIYYDISRERNYRLLVPSVICEECIADSHEIRDYKFFCYKGKPRAVQVDTDRFHGHKRRLYTLDWEPLEFRYTYPLADVQPRPHHLDRAIELATRLAAYFEFVRVDMYFVGDRIYLGELTHVPDNAHSRFDDIEHERRLSELIFGA